jgi:hypothetical protein
MEIHMKRQLTLTLATLLAATAGALATPYWVDWEDGWPEAQGWTRDILGGGDVRTLADGMMTLDGLNSPPGFVWDAYEQFRPGAIDPGPGETFVMQWRMRVDGVTNGNWDPGVFVYSDEWWALSFEFSMGELWSTYEGPFARVPFSAGVFHEYEVRSSDMRTYDLFIDGSLARGGAFVHNIPPGSFVGWGDVTGSSSLSVWDTFRYGVVPEPGGAAPLILVLIAARARRTC